MEPKDLITYVEYDGKVYPLSSLKSNFFLHPILGDLYPLISPKELEEIRLSEEELEDLITYVTVMYDGKIYPLFSLKDNFFLHPILGD